VTGASTLTAAEVDELRRAAAVGPLDPVDVRRVLEDHDRVQRERAELKATLDHLAPAWRELRSVLNELNRVLGT
jgi:chromosome segregation ATPase